MSSRIEIMRELARLNAAQDAGKKIGLQRLKVGAGELEPRFGMQASEPVPREAITPVGYRPTPTALKFHKDFGVWKLLMGPLGCGKTTAVCRDVAFTAVQVEPIGGVRFARALALRNTYPELRRTTIRDFLALLPPAFEGEMTFNKNENFFQCKHAGPNNTRCELEVEFISYDGHGDDKKLKGTNSTKVWANEGKELPFSGIMTGASRSGRYPGQPPKPLSQFPAVVVDTNCFDVDSEIYRFFFGREGHSELISAINNSARKNGRNELHPDDFCRVYNYPSALVEGSMEVAENAENAENLGDAYYPTAAAGRTKAWVDVYLRNKFGVTVDGAVCFTEFSDRNIAPASEAPRKEWGMFIGIDPGVEAGIVIGQRTPDGRHLTVYDEFVSERDTQTGDSMALTTFLPLAGEYIRRKYPSSEGWRFEMGWCDPSGDYKSGYNIDETALVFCREILQNRFGIPVAAARTNNVAVRINAVNGVFSQARGGRPALMVRENCRKLIRACRLYHYKRLQVRGSGEGVRYDQKPNKTTESHIADALQYFVIGDGGAVATLEARAVKRPADVPTRIVWGEDID